MASQKPTENGSPAQATIAVHGGQRSEESPFGAVVAPVFHTSTFSFENFATMRRYARGESTDGFFYSRYANPTVAEVERKIAELEGAEACVVTASGSAATFAALVALCESGDEVIASDSIYGGTAKILTRLLSRFGVCARLIPLEEIANLPSFVSERTRVLWFESPANPINRIVDLNKAAEVARETGVFSIIDNTFATPILQKPLSLGIDAVMHSATKYLGGHSDLTAGAIAGSHEFVDRVRQVAVAIGATLDPAAAYLLSRGIRTLDLRVRTACDNAMRLAEILRAHKKVARVYYPGLKDDPGHHLAKSQMKAFGGVVAMDLIGGEREVEVFYDALQLVRTAPSLGGVETLVSYPLYSSHVGFSEAQLLAAGVSAATVRFALGIEAAEDIIADVTRALAAI